MTDIIKFKRDQYGVNNNNMSGYQYCVFFQYLELYLPRSSAVHPFCALRLTSASLCSNNSTMSNLTKGWKFDYNRLFCVKIYNYT